MPSNMTSTEILDRLLTVEGINAAVIVGRDGFVIEASGALLGSMELDWIGASVGMVLRGTDRMADQLKIVPFHTMTLESAEAMIICYPVGEAVLAVIAPDSSAIGMIRMEAKKHLPELSGMF